MQSVCSSQGWWRGHWEVSHRRCQIDRTPPACLPLARAARARGGAALTDGRRRCQGSSAMHQIMQTQVTSVNVHIKHQIGGGKKWSRWLQAWYMFDGLRWVWEFSPGVLLPRVQAERCKKQQKKNPLSSRSVGRKVLLMRRGEVKWWIDRLKVDGKATVKEITTGYKRGERKNISEPRAGIGGCNGKDDDKSAAVIMSTWSKTSKQWHLSSLHDSKQKQISFMCV